MPPNSVEVRFYLRGKLVPHQRVLRNAADCAAETRKEGTR
jgi:hypothetical protein